MPKDLLVNRDAHFNESKSIKIFGIETMEYVYFDNNYKKPGYKYSEVYPDGMWTQRSPIDNVMCINKRAKNPELALVFLDLLSTDPAVYEAVLYGIEGKTYVKKGDSFEYPEGMTADTSNYIDWPGQWGVVARLPDEVLRSQERGKPAEERLVCRKSQVYRIACGFLLPHR